MPEARPQREEQSSGSVSNDPFPRVATVLLTIATVIVQICDPRPRCLPGISVSHLAVLWLQIGESGGYGLEVLDSNL